MSKTSPAFLITVDTEADNQWARRTELELKNISCLPRFQQLCEKYGFKPTYLVTHEVATDPRSVEILRPYQDKGRAEIGAHLHPWTNPPYARDISEERKIHRFPHELEAEEFRSKLSELTAAIEQNFGFRPTAYRAGRWGFAEHQAPVLLELGYLVDCSVTPKISWQRLKGDLAGTGGPDFRFKTIRPYFINKLLELPLTTVFHPTLENTRWAEWFLRQPESFSKKVLNKLIFRLTTARVFTNSKAARWRQLIKVAQSQSLPMIEFMIHSSELLPGGSPYNPTNLAVEQVYARLETMLALFRQAGFRGMTISEFAHECNA